MENKKLQEQEDKSNQEQENEEENVGINEYVNNFKKIEACYKYNVSDFVVQEIDKFGNRVTYNPSSDISKTI